MENKIAVIREEKRISQEELAEACGINRTVLSMIETGKTNPRVDTVAKIVNVLGVPANEIFFGLDVQQTKRRKKAR